MDTVAFPPALILFAGAFLLPFLGGIARQAVALAAPLLTLWAVWLVPDGNVMTLGFMEYTLTPVEGDRLSRLFATIFTIMAFTGTLFSLGQGSKLELPSAFVYAGGAVGVAFAGDMITMFVFWEIMAVASTAVIWSAGTDGAYKASMRYITMHLFGGVVLMAGIVGLVAQTGSIEFGPMKTDNVATWLILIGFLVNAGAPPFSSWLPDAYPEASWSGTVFLSAFTTKTAVYVLLRGFPGTEILIPIGSYMIFYGIIYALLENDMRRILSYSIINQVGFMVVGIGIGTELTLNGAAAHAFTHIIYKALLLMSAGSVLLMTGGVRRCTDLGGLFKCMPYTALMGIIGALAISSFPFTSGFISKSMIAQGAANQHMFWVWMGLAAASAGVFLHAGIKYPWYVFFQKDSGKRPSEPPLSMKISMGIFAFLCIGLGVYPDPLYAILPYPVDYVPYTTGHVVTMLQLLLFSGLAFFVMLPYMKRTLTITLDFDWFYRKLFRLAAREVVDRTSTAHTGAFEDADKRLSQLIARIFKTHGPHGLLARTWPTGSMVLWAAALLALSLVFYYQ
ncbi:MAG: Na(+)/H(+) antiporter subunit D [Rhodospirillaceae bacterium]|nr:Na(+)/H(+) antiporter subunit D [Rhodospirillaceae bacterium]MBT3493210.1 Na(+)/H(+) antiporter subunit D [Rhodospirillaceae bacterium]MBT3782113.1 Na(+)/H(+) antiporter subunit D [Rhodospirillaceae bacterium]MBT3977631.1 Na(+)/H(+) antiporter subunit D [Rhodospirillaceae bacterium]MBT4565985.1 Na(+)/H(+) antiporter subunit D [Rhodospirillaceae bacterium]